MPFTLKNYQNNKILTVAAPRVCVFALQGINNKAEIYQTIYTCTHKTKNNTFYQDLYISSSEKKVSRCVHTAVIRPSSHKQIAH